MKYFIKLALACSCTTMYSAPQIQLQIPGGDINFQAVSKPASMTMEQDSSSGCENSQAMPAPNQAVMQQLRHDQVKLATNKSLDGLAERILSELPENIKMGEFVKALIDAIPAELAQKNSHNGDKTDMVQLKALLKTLQSENAQLLTFTEADKESAATFAAAIIMQLVTLKDIEDPKVRRCCLICFGVKKVYETNPA